MNVRGCFGVRNFFQPTTQPTTQPTKTYVLYDFRVAVTAEVASSSLVVPAIPNQALTPVEEFSRGHKKVQIPREASIPRTFPL